jgi:hypothetical protein
MAFIVPSVGINQIGPSKFFGLRLVQIPLLSLSLISSAIVGQATNTATLKGAGALLGASVGHSTDTGTLKGAGALAGSAVGHTTDTGTLKGTGTLAGSILGHTTDTGTIQGLSAIHGTILGHTTDTATLKAVGALLGSATGHATDTGTLKGAAALLSALAGHATNIGTLKGVGALAGSAFGHTTSTGTVQNLGGPLTITWTNTGMGQVAFTLVGFDGNLPRVISKSEVISALSVTAMANGSFQISQIMLGNDVITPTGTSYVVRATSTTGGFMSSKRYKFIGNGNVDISSLTPEG